jgi:hypothetical protein
MLSDPRDILSKGLRLAIEWDKMEACVTTNRASSR